MSRNVAFVLTFGDKFGGRESEVSAKNLFSRTGRRSSSTNRTRIFFFEMSISFDASGPWDGSRVSNDLFEPLRSPPPTATIQSINQSIVPKKQELLSVFDLLLRFHSKARCCPDDDDKDPSSSRRPPLVVPTSTISQRR